MKQALLVTLLLACLRGAAQTVTPSDTIPFRLNGQHNIYVKAIFNQTDTLNLNFDTGTTELVLINSVLKNKLKAAPTLYSTRYRLQIGKITYQTRVYDAELTAQETDGRFGWDLFKNKVVELDYDKQVLIVHAALPARVATDRQYTKLALEFTRDLMLMPSTIAQSGVKNHALFLFDSGYQRTVMLDDDLLKEGGFPTAKMPVLKKVIMKGAQGNEIPVLTTRLARLQIGKYKLKNVPVQQLTTRKPLRNKNIHILGNEVLKRFNTFLDLQANVVYLKPNHFYHAAYTDQKKTGA